MEKPLVTEIIVRIDCNGCVQKIKKALHGINGISDIYINVPQQKLTIIGWADPEKILKAIKKTRKHAILFSETQSSPPTKPPLAGSTPPSDPSNPPPTSPKPNEPILAPAQAPTAQEPQSTPRQPPQLSGSKEEEEVHIVHHYPPDQGHGHRHDQRASVEHYSNPVQKHEPPLSVNVKHNYSTYKPTPCVTKYTRSPTQQFTHYNTPKPSPQQTHYVRPKPPQQMTHYNKPEPPPQQIHYARPNTQYNSPERLQPYTNNGQTELPPRYTNYSGEYHSSRNGNDSITSIFSDDNPNACTIV
ncbi:uncharacterized protein LOC143564779 [Bidens hawaiensis]|uniref:uncharacterized protein LOC143564779 n=1 Tax=Bidens hawaiensis TaxID=980011 RepID=UPI00404A776C